jgi:hypothetical protein
MTSDIIQNFLAFLNVQETNLRDLETFFEKTHISLRELRISKDTLTTLCHNVAAQSRGQASFLKDDPRDNPGDERL